jgi:hypothetical protein
MEITKSDLERIHQKFVSDPDWRIVELLLEQFMEPLKGINNIDTKGKTADEVFALVEGRKIAIDALNNFLSEIRLLKTSVTKQTEKATYK